MQLRWMEELSDTEQAVYKLARMGIFSREEIFANLRAQHGSRPVQEAFTRLRSRGAIFRSDEGWYRSCV